ncbi:unnamed protein product [Musa textilis]
MADFRQKQDTADQEFRRGLEELVRGHIDGCMTAALASCSSAASAVDNEDDPAPGGGGDAADQLARRRRRSDVEGDDLAETSAAARRHSRILSRWVARQAEEMITTIERRNRESELMALARLHTVSMLDSSFLRESRRSQTTVERPVAARASSVLQRWRELEGASSAVRERRSQPAPSPAATANNSRNGPESRSLAESIDGANLTSNESENNEHREEGNEPPGAASTAQDREREVTDDRESSREQSPDLGDGWDGERERVRQIVRGWMMGTAVAADAALRTLPRRESPRSDWLGETERERVRLARERVHLVSQQRHAQGSRTGEIERSATDHGNASEQARRHLPRLRGRQALHDLVMRNVQERGRELQGLSEHRAVSCFAYRSRIQSLLRGRFLRNSGPTENERRSSVAARELGQLRQHHPVSGLREELNSRQESVMSSQANSRSDAFDSHDANNSMNGTSWSNNNLDESQTDTGISEIYEATTTPVTVEMENSTESENTEWTEFTSQVENWQENAVGEEDWQQSTEDRFSGWRDGSEAEYSGNWQENIDHAQPHETPEGDAENRHNQVHGYWQEDDPQETLPIWQDESLPPLQGQQSISIRRVNRFILPDDDNVYSMELRELLSRRSVSNLLRSGFRESLDQLIESYVRRQEHNPFDWDLQRTESVSDSQEVDQGQQRDDMIEDQQISINETPPMLPSPPVPPPQPLWHSNLHHTNWTRRNMHNSEWDAINDLRADMARLQEGMSHMQQILEACFDMQLELQRAVKQEVSAALIRCSGGQGEEEEYSQDASRWCHVRKGTCCICCDSHIDSLLYRCGHMCTCSKCANELAQAEGRCPLCRAPILAVIRAYSVA